MIRFLIISLNKVSEAPEGRGNDSMSDWLELLFLVWKNTGTMSVRVTSKTLKIDA